MSRPFVKTYQYRAFTTRKGYAEFNRVLSLTRLLYNAALEHRVGAYKRGARVSVGYNAQSLELTSVRRDDPEFGAMSRRIQSGVLWRLDKAYSGFFRRLVAYSEGDSYRRPGLPRFKSERRWRTIEPRGVEKSWIKPRPDGSKIDLVIKGLPRLTLKADKKNPLPEKEQLVSISLTRRGRRIVASLGFRVETAEEKKTHSFIGLHFGVRRRITSSDGDQLTAVSRNDRKKNRLQRRMARQRTEAMKDGRAEWALAGWRDDSAGGRRPRFRMRWLEFSKSYAKTRDTLANLEYKEALRNRNYCHRITTHLIREHDYIALPDYDIEGMTRSARGTMEAPGTGVTRKKRANRTALSQTWGMIRRQLAYKAEWAGKQCVAVNPKDISNKCSKCGSVAPTANTSPRQYRCGSCDYVGDRSVNAALNILYIGFPDLPGHSPNGVKLLSIGAAGFRTNRSKRTVRPKYVSERDSLDTL